MKKKIDLFLPFSSQEASLKFINSLHNSEHINRITWLLSTPQQSKLILDGHNYLTIETPNSSQTISMIVDMAYAEYVVLITSLTPICLGYNALQRLCQIAEDSNASMIYADYQKTEGVVVKPMPVIDYQIGSLRDDFDFGPFLFFKTADLKQAIKSIDHNYQYAGMYALRLAMSRIALPLRINECLSTQLPIENVEKKSQFDYVDPKNRALQLEMEQACTEHLKTIGGYLSPSFGSVQFNVEDTFPVEASVIIPVRNRVTTVADAVRSVLQQKCSFSFNIIVIDNHSTDGTTALLKELSEKDHRVIHLIPNRDDLGIGGCWNWGIQSDYCGRFAVQLDSDDLYSDDGSLQKMVDAFYQQQCAMVVGTYRMTDFDLNTIAPGIIDHREWTPENGRNNALRINGLGAPRAFYTPLLRELLLPNTSYGEDYAMGLRISREYQIGRVYDVVYLCRRWHDNTDAALDQQKMNAHNLYKDRLRSWELNARIRMNQ